jgi:uncharacterized membrane protein YgaE (UPF0421/DUF939 family)
MGKNILLLISGAIIIYLLKNKQTKNKQVEVVNNARLLVGNGDQYKATFYSNKPLTAELIKQNNSHNYDVKLQGNIADDFIKISGVPVVY